MDEPTANLDYGHRHSALVRARKLASDGYTIVMSTHNPEHAFLYATKVVALFAGRVVAEGAPESVLTEELLERLYGIGVDLHEVSHEGRKVKLCLPQDSSQCTVRDSG
jgi:iron complex transport system ATP-binding protein